MKFRKTVVTNRRQSKRKIASQANLTDAMIARHLANIDKLKIYKCTPRFQMNLKQVEFQLMAVPIWDLQ